VGTKTTATFDSPPGLLLGYPSFLESTPLAAGSPSGDLFVKIAGVRTTLNRRFFLSLFGAGDGGSLLRRTGNSRGVRDKDHGDCIRWARSLRCAACCHAGRENLSWTRRRDERYGGRASLSTHDARQFGDKAVQTDSSAPIRIIVPLQSSLFLRVSDLGSRPVHTRQNVNLAAACRHGPVCQRVLSYMPCNMSLFWVCSAGVSGVLGRSFGRPPGVTCRYRPVWTERNRDNLWESCSFAGGDRSVCHQDFRLSPGFC
jgi:hypothetical protein